LLRLPHGALAYARLPRYPEVVPGDRVTVEGRWEPLPEVPEAGQEGWVAYLRRVGAAGTVTVSSLRDHGAGGDPTARLAALREGAAHLLATALPEPRAGLAAAMVVGLRARVDPELARDFTTAGISHVVAISGCHFAIVVGVVAVLTRGLARRPRSVVVAAVIVGYALVAGASPSVVRAALMSGVALLARESGRRAGAARALALTVATMLFLDPGLVAEAGFQLSAVATGGLVAWSAPLGARLERAVPWLPEALRGSLAVSLAAQAATLPVVLLDFGRISLVAPAANLLVAPLVALVMAGAALALPLGALLALGLPPALAAVPLTMAGLPLGALVWIAETAAAVPYASVELSPHVALPIAAVAGLALLAAAWRTGSSPLRRPAARTPAHPHAGVR
jgi:competence protein ComEC